MARYSLDDVNEGIQICLDELGEYKEKFDDFFNKNGTYEEGKLAEETGCGVDKVKNLLVYYTRLELGMKIKDCLDETGQCCFDADL